MMFMRLRLTALLLAASVSLSAQAPDRSKPPVPGPAPTLTLPRIQKQKLSNGLPVWLVEQHEVPVAQVNLLVGRQVAEIDERRGHTARDRPMGQFHGEQSGYSTTGGAA